MRSGRPFRRPPAGHVRGKLVRHSGHVQVKGDPGPAEAGAQLSTDDQMPTAAANEQVMLVVRIDTKPGAQREMSQALERLADATRRRDRGVVRFEVGLDPADDTRVGGYEIWGSQAALDEHSAKDHTKDFKAGGRDLVVDPQQPLHGHRWEPLRPEQPAAYEPGPSATPAPPPP